MSGDTAVAEAAEALGEQWRRRWPEALALWSRYTRACREPYFCPTTEAAAEQGLVGSFAMIRLVDSSVIVCLQLIAEYHLEDLALEVLGHEVGHHVLCPADLTDQGRLVVRMRWGLPGKEQLAPFLANLYADILINDRLRRSRELRMDEVYRRIGGGSTDRMWTLYLRMYEILWELRRGSLATGEIDDPLEGDARLGARLVRVYAGRWLEGAGRFAALCFPYLEDGAEEIRRILHAWRDAEGTCGAVPDGLTDVEAGEQSAVHPAFDPELAGDLLGEEDDQPAAPAPVERSAAAGLGQARQPYEYGDILRSLGLSLTEHEVAVRYYREQAARHLVPFPTRPAARATEPMPEGVEPWALGSPLEDLDWVETASRAPVVVPGVTTVQRTWGSAEGSLPAREPLDLDLYVDSSGSMPNPQQYASWLTLAGAVVALSALRAGGRVQATLWSGKHQFVTTRGFVADPTAVVRVLTGYLGGGTAFPIHVLRETFAERTPLDRAAHVFVISDDGVRTMFDTDELGNSGFDVSERALATARGGGTLALGVRDGWTCPEIERAEAQGWVVARVATEEELLGFCREFSHRTFGSGQ